MKRPLVMAGLLYAGGVVAGRWAPATLTALFGVSIGLGLLALAWGRARPLLLWALLPLAGWANESAHLATLAPDDLRTLFAHGPEQIRLRGVIREPITAKIFIRGASDLWKSSAIIETREVERDGQWASAFGRVIATTPGLLDTNYFTGREVIVTGVMASPRGPLAPGLFDAGAFYSNQGIYFQLQTEATNEWVPAIANQTPPLSQRFTTWARRTLALGLPEEDEAQRLIWTLALDWKTPLTEEVDQPFLNAGTYHIFAVDGLRIGLLAAMCMSLLRALQVPRGWSGAAVIPLIWAYAGLTDWPPSAVRATIMATVVVMGWTLRRPADLMNSLFAAAMIILCWNPQQMFQSGFQMSFVIVFCIAILFPPARAWIDERLPKPDPFLPEHLQRKPPELLMKCFRYLVDVFLLSCTAWLASIPLAAYYFHLFTPWSVPANFVVVPLTALTLIACAGSLLFGAWLPGISMVFNNAAWFYMKAIIVVSQWWSGWKPGSVNMASPSSVNLVWYYVVLLAVASGWIFRTKCKKWAWGSITAITILAAANWGIESQTTEIETLPVGGGVVMFDGKSDILMNCGNAFFAGHEIKPYLQAQGVNRLGSFCLTSDHVAEIGGAGFIRANFAVQQEAGIGKLHVGDAINSWSVLHPIGGEHNTRADDNAVVMRKQIGNWRILAMSTLGREGQDRLLNEATNLQSDIVIAGLPEKEEPLCEPLLAAIAPKVIIVVDAQTPATRRASEALENRLGRHGATVFYCRTEGALTIDLEGSKMEIKDSSGEILLTKVD